MTFSTKLYRSGNLAKLAELILLVCLFMPTITVVAEETGNQFYGDTKHGWFWYEDPPPVEELQEEIIQRKTVSLDTYSINDIWNMHPDDFQNLLNDLQKKAVQYPDEQNILEYLSMQDVARRKALAYTNVAMYVTQKHSDLFNVAQVYPSARPGITARVRMQQNEITQTIATAANNHALIFFVSPSCGFCEQQAQILAYFTDKYNWPIKIVDISRQIQAASRFNITITPTLLLIKKGADKSLTVSTGVITLSELERKLYRSIRHLQGDNQGDHFLMYDFERDTPLDPTSILKKGRQPWIRTD
jgi:conjugal transfer pilus assembly protein TraF